MLLLRQHRRRHRQQHGLQAGRGTDVLALECGRTRLVAKPRFAGRGKEKEREKDGERDREKYGGRGREPGVHME